MLLHQRTSQHHRLGKATEMRRLLLPFSLGAARSTGSAGPVSLTTLKKCACALLTPVHNQEVCGGPEHRPAPCSPFKQRYATWRWESDTRRGRCWIRAETKSTKSTARCWRRAAACLFTVVTWCAWVSAGMACRAGPLRGCVSAHQHLDGTTNSIKVENCKLSGWFGPECERLTLELY